MRMAHCPYWAPTGPLQWMASVKAHLHRLKVGPASKGFFQCQMALGGLNRTSHSGPALRHSLIISVMSSNLQWRCLAMSHLGSKCFQFKVKGSLRSGLDLNKGVCV